MLLVVCWKTAKSDSFWEEGGFNANYILEYLYFKKANIFG